MFEHLKQRMWIWKNARAVMRHYLRWPYRRYDPVAFDDFNHEHICFAVRFDNVDLDEICPLADKRNLIPGDQNACELCPYFGTINYQIDPSSGKKQLHFELRGDTVTVLGKDTKR